MEQRPLGTTGFLVSPLGLGTVEIGLSYDIADRELPDERTAETILRSAVDLGITYIDTARGYGVAEERLGKFGISKLGNVLVGTKCAQFLEQGEDPRGAELEQRLREEIEMSLTNLHVDSLPLVQLHGGSQEQIDRGELIAIMQKLKDEGKVQHVGIATRGAIAPQAAIASGFFETIQVAYNIVDQRMDSSLDKEAAPGGILAKARAKNIGIINRSVLLKGALTPKRSVLPDALAPLKTAADQAEQVAKDAGMDLPTLAIRFALSHPAVSTALIGTIKPGNLKRSIIAAEAGPLPNDILSELKALALADEQQIDPGNWPKD